ncbi:twin-arginine translocase subunit TatB [Candidatus Pelagibacter sp.]|jgi:sec-independent protein translocase protein TatB|uniref:twin arginine-targeting protein translocase TatB n=1 Tax=Pelagibacter ubique TaxID=198252 RepID=UPI000113B780|nr:twin arginine-targeting protein translocase TatB [Candidatus Pelagibacter ubique]MDC3039270.1 twin-arginine translocase subunit TatB [Candidatus Pelagibacter sp.]|tara:strand:- start:539 stop:775 length:237 start_codon:yes stop_codon:yes gene_type:complete
MPQIGWFELLLIIGLAVVIIGPKDFPIVLKKIGSWFGSIKRYISAVQSEVSNLEENTLDYENKENKDKKEDLKKDESK